jgi:formate hydrogenlyase transcriptional activator
VRAQRQRAAHLPDGVNRDVQALERYAWPGNVRELASVIERAAILAREGRLAIDAVLDRANAAVAIEIESERDRKLRERANIEAALAACGGKVYGPGGAAELLGMRPTTLASRIRALGLVRRR